MRGRLGASSTTSIAFSSPFRATERRWAERTPELLPSAATVKDSRYAETTCKNSKRKRSSQVPRLVRVSLSDRVPFPKVWDNTMLADLSSCEQKVNIRFFHHIRPNVQNVNLHAGASFAKGVEAVRRAAYTPNSTVEPRAAGARALLTHYGDFDPGDNVKSADRMLGALESYLTQYSPESDHIKPLILNGVPCVEFSFAHPIDVLHPEDGEPIILCGRFDALGVLNNDPTALFVVDEKTTKQLGPTWPKQWTLRSQFMQYTWGAKKYGHPVVGAIVRGLSILKRDFGHAEAICYFPDWMLDRWYEQVCLKLERVKQSWAANKFTFNFADACSSYGGCDYRMLCESQTPEAFLNPYFKIEPWNPLRLKIGTE